LIDEKPDFASVKQMIKQKGLELAIKEALRREPSNSSSYDDRSYDSRHGK